MCESGEPLTKKRTIALTISVFWLKQYLHYVSRISSSKVNKSHNKNESPVHEHG